MNIGFQLYSARHEASVEKVLRHLAELGYHTVEAYGAMVEDADVRSALAKGLAQTGLAMPTCHFNLAMIEADPSKVIEIAQGFGVTTIVVPHIAPEVRPDTLDGWRDFGTRLERSAQPFTEAGLQFAWHNHDFEFERVSDQFPLDVMLDNAPSMQLEFDLAWCARAGVDPLPVIQKYRDRIIAAHAKDLAPEGQALDEDGWADVGHGVLDWRGLRAALETTASQHLIAEHDNPSDVARFAERSMKFLAAGA